MKTSNYKDIKKRVIQIIRQIDKINKPEEYDNLSREINQIDEKTLVKVLLDILRYVDDSTIFLNILFLLENMVRLNTLPSKILALLRTRSDQDEFYYRLLAIYQRLSYAGYILEEDLEDLLFELNIKIDAFFRFVRKDISNNKAHTHNLSGDVVEGFASLKNDTLRKMQSEAQVLINKIPPVSELNPFNSKKHGGGIFNFPKGLKLNFIRHVKFLQRTFKDSDKFIRFINSNFEEFSSYFHSTQVKYLVEQLTRNYYAGRYKEASTSLKVLEKNGKKLSVVYYLKAKLLEAQGRPYKACEALVRSIDEDPFFIEKYMDLSYALNIGGYFYSSTVLTALLLRFCPFDFNFHMQLAINLYQLGYPFTHHLEFLNIVDPSRLANFLERFWPDFHFRPSDSLPFISFSRDKFQKYAQLSRLITEKSLNTFNNGKVLTINDVELKLQVAEWIKNPLNFFKTPWEHLQKNWFIYEIFQELFFEFEFFIQSQLPILEPFIISEKFICFCLELATQATNELIERGYNSTNHHKIPQDFANKVLQKEMVKDDEFFKFFSFFIKKPFIQYILDKALKKIIGACFECDKRCLQLPDKWCIAFYEEEIPYQLPTNLQDAYYLFNFLDTILIAFNKYSIKKFKRDKGGEGKDIRDIYDQNKVSVKELISEKHDVIVHFLIFLFKEKLLRHVTDLLTSITPSALLRFIRNYFTEFHLKMTQETITRVRESLRDFTLFLVDEMDMFKDVQFNKISSLLESSDQILNKLDL